MKKLVFICAGNMFRSQLAEAIFNRDPVADWHASSFGTDVMAEGLEGTKLKEFGNGEHFIIEEMRKIGVDISNEHCKQLMPTDLEDADKVIVMSEIEYTPKWLAYREDERWEVANPHTVTEEIAKDTISLLQTKIQKLKKTLK